MSHEHLTDVYIWFLGSHGVFIPHSEAAKELLNLEEGVDAVVVLDDPAKAMSIFPKDFVFETTEAAPKKIAVTAVERLH